MRYGVLGELELLLRATDQYCNLNKNDRDPPRIGPYCTLNPTVGPGLSQCLPSHLGHQLPEGVQVSIPPILAELAGLGASPQPRDQTTFFQKETSTSHPRSPKQFRLQDFFSANRKWPTFLGGACSVFPGRPPLPGRSAEQLFGDLKELTKATRIVGRIASATAVLCEASSRACLVRKVTKHEEVPLPMVPNYWVL